MSKAGISRKSCLQGKARMLISRGKMSRCHGQKRKLKHVIPRRQTSLRRRMMRALKPPRSAPWRPGKARHAKQPSTPTSGRLTATRSSSPLGRHNFHKIILTVRAGYILCKARYMMKIWHLGQKVEKRFSFLVQSLPQLS